MVCARCGTTFEGRFCPNCGTPAGAAPAPAPAPPVSFRCGRCGTIFSGQFCPACGLPAWSPWIPPPMPRGPSTGFVLLNIAWVFSIIAFLVILAISVAGMFAAMPTIATGIGSIRQGATADRGFDASAGDWTFHFWTANLGATGGINSSGGNPGAYAWTQLEGRQGEIVSGYWSQAFTTSGSNPYLAGVFLDYRVLQVSNILGNVTIAVYLDRSSGAPRLGTEVWSVALATTTGWTPAQTVDPSTGEKLNAIDVSAKLPASGTYYLKVAAIAWNQPGGGPGTPTIVGLDNVSVRWWTNAWIDVFVFAPVPVLLALTQEPLAFYVWTVAIVAVAVACVAVLVARDGRKLLAAVKLSSEQMPAKLRSRSAFVALMQTYLAVLFLSVVLSIALQPPEPPFFSAIPLWYFVWSLLNAPVYEELVFRVLMIGVPMMAGSFYFRLVSAARGRVPAGTSAGRFLAGSLRYLWGGGVHRTTPPGTLLPALFLMVASSVVFGFAHAPGYGDWKVLPTLVAGIAMGYLFLRHGLHIAILFHFATDAFVGTAYLVGLDSPLGVAMNLGLFFLALTAGAGFFVYYFLYTFRFAQDVIRGGRARTVPSGAAPASVYPAPATAPAGATYATAPGPVGPPVVPQPQMPSGYVPATRPPGYGTSPVEYRCPRCAWVEAAYENGRFRCLRCGHVS